MKIYNGSNELRKAAEEYFKVSTILFAANFINPLCVNFI